MPRQKVNKEFTVYPGFDEALEALKNNHRPGLYMFYIQIDDEWFKIGYSSNPLLKLRMYRINIDGTEKNRVQRSGIVGILGPNDNCEVACRTVVRLLQYRIKNKKTKHERDELSAGFDSNTFKMTQKECENMLIRNL